MTAPPAPVEDTTVAPRGTVLVVDDEDSVRLSVRAMLEGVCRVRQRRQGERSARRRGGCRSRLLGAHCGHAGAANTESRGENGLFQGFAAGKHGTW